MLNRCHFVLQRRIRQPLHTVRGTLAESSLAGRAWLPLGVRDGAVLRVDQGFEPRPHGLSTRHHSWCSTGQLRGARGGLVARIEIELGTWDHGTTELQLRPTGHPERWSARRARRYFALAHDAADQLGLLLSVPPVAAEAPDLVTARAS